MFEKHNPFKEKVKAEGEQLNEQEKLARRLIFMSDSVKDFTKAKEIAGKITDQKTRESTLNKIIKMEEGREAKTSEKKELGGQDLEIEDLYDAINSGDLKDAKSIVSHLAKNDENYAARAYLEIAKAEIEKKLNPEKAISRAREIAKAGEDPWYKIAIFADIMKLEAWLGLYNRARQTATETKNMPENKTGRLGLEYDARLFATIAETEKNIGLSTEELKNLDKNTVNYLINHPDRDVVEAIQSLRREKSEEK